MLTAGAVRILELVRAHVSKKLAQNLAASDDDGD
jgi:hypothetical protein